MLWHRQVIFEPKGDKLSLPLLNAGFEPTRVSDIKSPADWMSADKPTELSRIKLKTWTRQPVPMISEHSAHSIPHRRPHCHSAFAPGSGVIRLLCISNSLAAYNLKMAGYAWSMIGSSLDQLLHLTHYIHHNEYDGVSNHRCRDGWLKLFVQALIKGNIKIHWWPANSSHKRPVTRKMFSFDDVILNVLSDTAH